MLTSLKHRPVMIAERHNASGLTFAYGDYLKKNPTETFDYCLFEGALDTQSHLENAKNACSIYYHLISDFLSSKDKNRLRTVVYDDLQHELPKLTEFSQKHKHHIDIKKYPYGFGQIRNLTTHFLLYQHLSKHNTQWIAIDDKRAIIKKMAEDSILKGTAYLYKRHKNIGQITTLKQKILLEAAPIRSKYMSDKIFDYATKGRCLVLMGNRHALDIMTYTPDLADIFGYNPHNDHDTSLYYYNIHHNPVRYDMIQATTEFNIYYRPVTFYNTSKIKSDFNIKNYYSNI